MAGVVALALASCSSGGGSSSDDSITIGLMADLSGSYQTYGYPAVNGAMVEANLINQAGGVKVGNKSYTIKFSVCETNSDQAQASACARKFVQQQGIKFVMGGTGSLGPPIATITDPAKVMYWAPGSALAAQMSNLKFTYSVLPTNADRLNSDVQGVKKVWPDAKRVAFLVSDEPTSTVLPQLVQDFQKAGYEVTAQTKFSASSGGQNLTPQLSSIAPTHPDVIFTGWAESEIAPVLSANENLKVTNKIYASTGPGTCSILKSSVHNTQLVSNDLVGADLDHPANNVAKQFGDAYRQYVGPSGESQYKNDANLTTIGSALYFPDSIALLAKAISTAGSTSDTAAIQKAMTGTSVDGTSGAFSYGSDRFAVSGLTACTLNVDAPGGIGSILIPPAS